MKRLLFLAFALVGCVTSGENSNPNAGNIPGLYAFNQLGIQTGYRLEILSDLSAKSWMTYRDSVSKDSALGVGSFKGDTLIVTALGTTSGQVCKTACQSGYLYSGDTLYSVIEDTTRLKSPVPVFVKIPAK